MDKETKNAAIKQAIKETREKHKGMRCRTIEVKVTASKLSSKKEAMLNQYFLEAKWLRNSELAKGYENMNRDAKTATIKVGDHFEERKLLILGSQMRQDIVDSLRAEIRGLATKKKKGEKVGALKFKSFCNSIPLRQYGTTYSIDFVNNTISIQGMRNFPIKVRGLKQFPKDKDYDITSAKLIRKPSGLYFHITVYTPIEEKPATGNTCGIDFGISNNMTLDNGDKYNIWVPEIKGVKLASKRLNKSYHRYNKLMAKQKTVTSKETGTVLTDKKPPKPKSKKIKGKKSKRHYRRVHKLRAAYERQNNKKSDIANKIVHDLESKYDFIAIQDEMIAGWHKGLFGKQVQHSAMGVTKAKLKLLNKTHVIDRSFPSTQICPKCMQNTKHDMTMREYHCKHCGYYYPDRDVKAAYSIFQKAQQMFVTA